MMELLGEDLARAKSILAEMGIDDVRVIETEAPRGRGRPGRLRVVRIRDNGSELIVSQFPDEVEIIEAE